MYKEYLRYGAMAFTLLLTACSTGVLKTDISFHEIAISPQERINKTKNLDLPFNAYVIGVEKDNKSRVGEIAECSNSGNDACLRINAEYYTNNKTMQDKLRQKYTNQHRPTFISHVVKFTKASSSPCFLYNVYKYGDSCKPSGIVNKEIEKGKYVQYGWEIMDELQKDIAEYASSQNPSHVLVYFMGWNTPQWEAMQNFRDLYGNLMSAAKDNAEFKPLFIGVTWPSTGNPKIPASDFGIKAKDADEVGALWGNILINRVLSELKKEYGFKVVVVGHSFGARASSRAVFSAPLVSDKIQKNVELLLGLQGAYSFQRYVYGVETENEPDGIEGSPYRDYAKMAGKVALTSSVHDTAVTQAGHAPYFVGSKEVFDKTSKSMYHAIFEHRYTDENGNIELQVCNGDQVMFIDASNIINKNHPGTGGFAHSYIYTPTIGRLTYQLIQECAK